MQSSIAKNDIAILASEIARDVMNGTFMAINH